MSKTYIVTTEARENGAIGIFYPVSFKVRATSTEEARERFIEGVRNRVKALSQYEFNSIREISPLK